MAGQGVIEVDPSIVVTASPQRIHTHIHRDHTPAPAAAAVRFCWYISLLWHIQAKVWWSCPLKGSSEGHPVSWAVLQHLQEYRHAGLARPAQPAHHHVVHGIHTGAAERGRRSSRSCYGVAVCLGQPRSEGHRVWRQREIYKVAISRHYWNVDAHARGGGGNTPVREAGGQLQLQDAPVSVVPRTPARRPHRAATTTLWILSPRHHHHHPALRLCGYDHNTDSSCVHPGSADGAPLHHHSSLSPAPTPHHHHLPKSGYTHTVAATPLCHRGQPERDWVDTGWLALITHALHPTNLSSRSINFIIVLIFFIFILYSSLLIPLYCTRIVLHVYIIPIILLRFS